MGVYMLTRVTVQIRTQHTLDQVKAYCRENHLALSLTRSGFLGHKVTAEVTTRDTRKADAMYALAKAFDLA